jgi:hypothetical protein
MTAFDVFKRSIQGWTDNLLSRVLVIGLAAIAIALLLWNGLHSLFPPIYSVTTKSEVINLIVSGVHSETELTTARTNVKETVVIKKVAQVLGLQVGETDLVYEGVGTVRAGIDLSKLEVTDLIPERHSVHILLPSPTISEVNLDVEQSAILADYRKWFGPKAGTEIYEEAQREAKYKMKQQACANEILEASSSNAKQLLEGILTKVGFEEVVIETQLPAKGTCPV